jgi:hypothetical protein
VGVIQIYLLLRSVPRKQYSTEDMTRSTVEGLPGEQLAAEFSRASLAGKLHYELASW